MSKQLTDYRRSSDIDLPNGWTVTTIGKITHTVEKVSPDEQPEVQFTYLDISSIDNSLNVISSPKTYLGAEAPSRARQLVMSGDTLFSTVRTYLRNIAMVPKHLDQAIASTGFSVLRPVPGVDPHYVFYYSLTESFIDTLSELQRGTSYPAVRDSDVREQLIPLAPSSEQKRIVAEIEKQFTRLDAAVTNLHRVQTNLQRYKASVLKAACEGRLVPQEATLNPDYEPAGKLLERILAERRRKWEEDEWQNLVERAQKKVAQAHRKAAGLPHYIRDLQPDDWQHIPESEYRDYLPKNDKWKQKYEEPQPPDTDGLPELPEGWVWATVEGLAAPDENSVTDGPFGSKLKTAHYTESGPRVIRLQNIGDGKFINEKAHISEQHFDSLRKHRVFAGDIVIGALGTSLPRSCIIPEYVGPAIVKADCIRFYPNPNHILAEYVNIVLNSEMLKRYSAKIVHGVGRPRLNQQEIKALPIPVPPLAEQQRIVESAEARFSILTSVMHDVQVNSQRADRLRQSILQQAFSGKLVPQDPDDEPASRLLARIKRGHDQPQEKQAENSTRRRQTGRTPIQQSLFDEEPR